MTTNTLFLLAIALVVGIVAGIAISRYAARKGGVTVAAVEAAVAHATSMLAAHEAQTRQAAIDAQQATEKRALAFKQLIAVATAIAPVTTPTATPPIA